MKTRTTHILAALLGGSALLMAGCGSSSDQDSGNGGTTTLSGTAVDGHLNGSLVFQDVNENGELDAYEPRSLVEKGGGFDLEVSNQEGTLRVLNGYDQATGEAFEGSIAAVTDAEGNLVVSPLTGLLVHLEDTSAFLDLINGSFSCSTDVKADDLTTNFMDTGFSKESCVQYQLVATAQQLHRVAEVLGEHIDNNAADGAGAPPASPARYAYEAIAAKLDSGYSDFAAFWSGEASNVYTKVEGLVTGDGYTYSAYTDTTNALADMVTKAGNIANEFDNDTTGVEKGLKGTQRVMEVASEAVKSGDSQAAKDTVAAAADSTNNSFRNDMAKDSVDTGDVGEKIKGGTNPQSGFDYSNRPTLINKDGPILAETKLSFTEDSNKDNKAIVYFDKQSVGENVVVCVDYSGAKDQTYNTDGGIRVTGSWQMVTDYSVKLDLNVADFRQAFLLKVINAKDTDSDGQQNYDKLKLGYDWGRDGKGLQTYTADISSNPTDSKKAASEALTVVSSGNIPEDEGACQNELGKI